MDRMELRALGDRLRRATSNKEVLAYIDGTLPLLVGKAVRDCPACLARRQAKTAAQKKWRKKQKEAK